MASDKHINSNFAKEEVDESTQQKTAECGIVNTEQHEYDGGLQVRRGTDASQSNPVR